MINKKSEDLNVKVLPESNFTGNTLQGSNGLRVLHPDEKTIDFVKMFIQENSKDFEFLPIQKGVSFPIIKRFIEMLIKGNIPPAIIIEGGAILNGHHRFISGRIFGKLPNTQAWTRSSVQVNLDWLSVMVDINDWGDAIR